MIPFVGSYAFVVRHRTDEQTSVEQTNVEVRPIHNPMAQ
jgi:hypothetical protein